MNLESHEFALAIPEMKRDEYVALVADIRANGLREPLMLFEGKILDGRHRARACAELGIAPATEQFVGTHEAARKYVDSINVHRRHLSYEQRKTIIESELRRDPAQSDRAIATKARVHHETVAAARDGLEATGEIRQLDRRNGKDGKARRQPTTGLDVKHSSEDRPRAKNGRAIGLKPGTKLETERVAEISTLAKAGHNKSQIAEQLGLSAEHVKNIANRNDIDLGPKSGRRINSRRVVTETVNLIVGAAGGLAMIELAAIVMPTSEARELLTEFREALRPLRQLESRLKEIVNG